MPICQLCNVEAEGETATGEVQSGHFLRVSEKVFLFAAGNPASPMLGNNSQMSIFLVRFFRSQPQEKNRWKMAFHSSKLRLFAAPPGSV